MSTDDQIAALLPLAELVAIADQARKHAPRYPHEWHFVVPKIRHADEWLKLSLSADYAMAPSDDLRGTMEHHPVEERSCPGGVKHIHHYYKFNGCLL